MDGSSKKTRTGYSYRTKLTSGGKVSYPKTEAYKRLANPSAAVAPEILPFLPLYHSIIPNASRGQFARNYRGKFYKGSKTN